MWKRLWKSDEGQDLTEYALLLILLALACTVGIGKLALAINGIFTDAASNLAVTT